MSKAKKIIAVVGAFVMGAFFTVIGAQEFLNSKRLAAEGVATTGEVLDQRERISGKQRRHSYYLTVQFRTEAGQSIRKEVSVERGVFDAAVRAGSVKVYYVASQPGLCSAGEQVEIKYGSLLFGVGLLGCGVVLILFAKVPVNQQELVETIDQQSKPLKMSRHEYVAVDPRQFKHLDLAFYDNGRRHLEARGYFHLADEENLTVSRSSQCLRTFIRSFLARDGTSMAALFELKPSWMLRLLKAKGAKVIDVETWFSNGSFLCTSNAAAAGILDWPAVLNVLFLPVGSPIDLVLEAHEKRLNKFLSQNPGVQPVRLNGIEDARRAQDEMQRIKAEHRRDSGISKAELERLAGSSGPVVDKLHAAVARRHARPASNAVTDRFPIPKVFQAKPSNFKKKLALVAFAAGAIAFTLAATGVIGQTSGGPYFAGGLVAMALAFRFWNMQVRSGPTAVTFDAGGITIANRAASDTIGWADLESLRYRVWRGGHYWEFKSRTRKKTLDYYVDGLSSTQLDELRETISSIQLPGVVIEPFYNPIGS